MVPWLTILLALLPLLIRLLAMLAKTQKDGSEIPARVRKKLAKCQGLMLQVNARAVEMGCKPEEH
jgi:hypothetical protein